MNAKKEFPDEGELVLGTVDRIVGTSIFIKLDNYGKEGVMVFSEVAPGRIRNIRDYIVPKKKVVCKVNRVDPQKGHIDLSLRRVTAREKKEIMDIYNKERANTIVIKMITKKEGLADKIKGEFGPITQFFEELMKDKAVGKKFLNDEELDKIIEFIKEKEKQKRVKVNLRVKIEHSGANGIEVIKQTLIKEKGSAEITYIGAPNYLIVLEGNNYKEANKKIREIAEKIVQEIKIKGGKAEILETK